MAAASDDLAPETPLSSPAPTDNAPKIQPLQPREKLKPRQNKKPRLRSNMVYGEDRLEAANQDGSLPDLERLPDGSTATAGTWSRETPQVAISGMDEAYHAKVRINQIRIEWGADALRTSIWLGLFGFLLPGFTLYEGVEWLGWQRWICVPIMVASVAAMIALYRPQRRWRKFAYSWMRTVFWGYIALLLGLCSGQIGNNVGAAESWYLGFVYFTFFVTLWFTPLRHIRRLEWEWAQIDEKRATNFKPPELPVPEDDMDIEVGWDQGELPTPNPASESQSKP